ncbi:MAG: HAD family hydrolase, partial [bacterium]
NVPQQILETAVDVFFSPELGLYPIVPQVPEVLTELKTRGYKLAVVSNATSGRLIRQAMAMRDLTRYFETIIVSAEVGYRKPHPKIFQLAMDFLNVTPEQTVMVGDLLEFDVIGANNLGIKSILAKYVLSKEDYNPPKADIIPDAIVTSFPEILKYIEQFNKTS